MAITYREAPSALIRRDFVFDSMVGGKPVYLTLELAVGPRDPGEGGQGVGKEGREGEGGEGNLIECEGAVVSWEGAPEAEVLDTDIDGI